MNPFRRATVLLMFAALASGGVFVACGPTGNRDSTPMGSASPKDEAPKEKTEQFCNNPVDMTAAFSANSSGSPDDRDAQNQPAAPVATTPTAADVNSSGSPDDRDKSLNLGSDPSKDGALQGKFKLSHVQIYVFNEANYGSFIVSANATDGFKGSVDCASFPMSNGKDGAGGISYTFGDIVTSDYDADSQTFGTSGKAIVMVSQTDGTITMGENSDTQAILHGQLTQKTVTTPEGKTTYLWVPISDSKFELRTKRESAAAHGSRMMIYTSAIYESTASATTTAPAPDATTTPATTSTTADSQTAAH